jgi:outer membrane protein assembly factor BamB
LRRTLLALWISLYALSAFTQTPGTTASATWRQAMGAVAITTPSAQAGSAVVVCDDGCLRAFGRSGSALWTWDSLSKLLPTLIRSREGTSYVVISGGRLAAVNRSGRELWRRTLGGVPSSASILLGWDGRLFVATEGFLFCFTPSGFPLWKRPLPSRPLRPPALDEEGGVVLALADGKLFRSSPFGELSIVQLPKTPLAFAPLFATEDEGGGQGSAKKSDEVAFSFADGSVIAYSRSGGGRSLASLSSPSIELKAHRGILAYALSGGEVGLLRSNDGGRIWSGSVPRAEGGYFRIDERGIYFLSRRGSAGFSFDGRRLWNLNIDGASAPPALDDDGLLYSGGEDWILYAYRVEDRVRAEGASIYGPAPVAVYGLGESADDSRSLEGLDEVATVARLNSIGKTIEVAEIGGEEPAFTADLMRIAGSARGTLPVPYRPPAPHLRELATVLLSRFASSETIPFFIDLFNRDKEPFVRAAAAEAIGAIGIDPGGRALRAFASAIFPPQAVHEERLLYALAVSIGSLCRASGPPLSDTGVILLVSLAGDDRPPSVREKARAELESLTSR